MGFAKKAEDQLHGKRHLTLMSLETLVMSSMVSCVARSGGRRKRQPEECRPAFFNCDAALVRLEELKGIREELVGKQPPLRH